MLLGDLSLKANIGGTELLIFPSDKLPERIQREFFLVMLLSLGRIAHCLLLMDSL
jgi:hypothetical protein